MAEMTPHYIKVLLCDLAGGSIHENHCSAIKCAFHAFISCNKKYIAFISSQSNREWLPNLLSQKLVYKCPMDGIPVESRQVQKEKPLELPPWMNNLLTTAGRGDLTHDLLA